MKAFKGPLILGSPVLQCGKYPEAPGVCNDYTQFYKYNGAAEWEHAGDFVGPPEGWVRIAVAPRIRDHRTPRLSTRC